MFLAEFKKKKEKETVPTLRQRIVGTTNAGKAFRVGALASGAGLAALAYNKRGALKNMASNPKDFFSRPTEPEITAIRRKKQVVPNPEYNPQKPFRDRKGNLTNDPNAPGAKSVEPFKEIYDSDWHDNRRTQKKGRSFAGTGRNVNWGRVGKIAGVGVGALAVPTGAAYVVGSKKDKEDIQNRVSKTWGESRKAANDIRSWINTLHRVSR